MISNSTKLETPQKQGIANDTNPPCIEMVKYVFRPQQPVM